MFVNLHILAFDELLRKLCLVLWVKFKILAIHGRVFFAII